MIFFRHQTFVCILFFILQSTSLMYSQEIKAIVTVNLEAITVPNERDNLSTLQIDIQNYLNSNSFTGKEFKNEVDKIKWKDEQVQMNMSVTVLSGTQQSGRYNALVVVTAQRPLFGSERKSVTMQFVDKNWSFLYARGASPAYQPLRFDEFASFLDMFALICIGFDLDSYEELGGTAYFQRAQQIINMGANYADPVSGQLTPGYRINPDNPSMVSRAGLVQELLDIRLENFRRLTAAYYLNGLDYLSDKPDQAKASIDALLTKMADVKDRLTNRSILMQVFFDSKYRECADLFKGTNLPKVWDKLKYLDPSHSLQYEQAQKSR